MELYRWKISLLNTDKIFLLLLWLLIPIILPFTISRLSTPIYHTKYTIVASLAFYLIVSKGISNIPYRCIKIIVVIVIVAFSMVYLQRYYTKINKQQWRDVANYIDTNANKLDMLLFHEGAMNIAFNYYSKRSDLIKRRFPEKGGKVDEETIKELEPTVEGYRRVWIILSHSKDEKELITKKLTEAYRLSYQKKYVGIKLLFFERRG